jgi:hypothetical protein
LAHSSQERAISLFERKNNEVLHVAGYRRRSNCHCGFGIARRRRRGSLGALDASQTVGQLQARGFDVIVNKVGTAPLDRCVVNAVRPGHTFSRMDSGVPGAMDDIVTTVTAMTVFVDVAC